MSAPPSTPSARLRRHAQELDSWRSSGRPSVQSGPTEEILDEAPHAGGLGADACITRSRSSARVASALLEQLRVGGDRGERGAQLVRGVGLRTAASGLLRPAAPVRWRLAARTPFDPPQHRVERPGQPSTSVRASSPGTRSASSPRAMASGRALDRPQGPEADPHQPPAHHERGQEGGAGDGELDTDQAVEGRDRRPQGDPDHELATFVGAAVEDRGAPAGTARRRW